MNIRGTIASVLGEQILQIIEADARLKDLAERDRSKNEAVAKLVAAGVLTQEQADGVLAQALA